MPSVVFKKSGVFFRKDSPARVSTTPKSSLQGKTIYYPFEGRMIPAKVEKDVSGELTLRLAIPDSEGVLRVTDTRTVVDRIDGLRPFEAVTRDAKMRRFTESVDGETKAVAVKDDDGVILDYRDVFIEGYASTFKETTPEDRDGDYIIPGAFDKTLSKFRKNPVLLENHENRVQSLAGKFVKIGVDSRGLAVRAQITNAPGHRDTRFKIAEGILKALSIGGLFIWVSDGKGIEEVDLWETSLIPIPANPDALTEARAITLEDVKKALTLNVK